MSYLRNVIVLRQRDQIPIACHSLTKDGSTSNLSLRMPNLKQSIVRLDNWQHHHLKIFVTLCHHNINFSFRTCCFEPNKPHLRKLLNYFLNFKKSATDGHRLHITRLLYVREVIAGV